MSVFILSAEVRPTGLYLKIDTKNKQRLLQKPLEFDSDCTPEFVYLGLETFFITLQNDIDKILNPDKKSLNPLSEVGEVLKDYGDTFFEKVIPEPNHPTLKNKKLSMETLIGWKIAFSPNHKSKIRLARMENGMAFHHQLVARHKIAPIANSLKLMLNDPKLITQYAMDHVQFIRHGDESLELVAQMEDYILNWVRSFLNLPPENAVA